MPKRKAEAPENWFSGMFEAILRVADVLIDIADHDPDLERRKYASETFSKISALGKKLAEATAAGDLAGAVAAAMATGVIAGSARITDVERWAAIARHNAECLAGPNRECGESNRRLVAGAYSRIKDANPELGQTSLVRRVAKETLLGERTVWKYIPKKGKEKTTARR